MALGEAAQQVQRAQTPEQVYRSIGDEITRLGNQAVLFMLTPDAQHLRVEHLTYQKRPSARRRETHRAHRAGLRMLRSQTCRCCSRCFRRGAPTMPKSAEEFIAGGLPARVRHLSARIGKMMGLGKLIAAPLSVGEAGHGICSSSPVRTSARLTSRQSWLSPVKQPSPWRTLNSTSRDRTRQHLSELAGRLQAEREEERTYLAREIHDELGQLLSALHMDLGWLARHIPAEPRCPGGQSCRHVRADRRRHRAGTAGRR